MKRFPVACALLCAALLSCGNPANPPPAPDAGGNPGMDGGVPATSDAGSPSPDAGNPGFTPGLQYNGSIAFQRTSP
jgi:hypothetical protein